MTAVACVLIIVASSDRAAALTGAERMPPEAFRFVAYVGDDHGYCTGAIIAPTWVLTAAHCVVKGDGSTISPDEIGGLSRGWPDDDWEKVPVKRVISHPHYYWQGDGFRNDVALLETVRPFASSDMVPVEVLGLADEALYAANGTTAVMVGYGEDENGQRDRDGLFRVVSAPLHHADACRVEHSFVDSKGEIVHEGTICAGDRAKGIRGGDSGGPLLVRTDEGAYGLIGIASISGHDRSGHPVVAVYTRVATVKDWIDSCVLGTGECVEGGVRLTQLKRHDPDAIRGSETLEQRSTAIVFVNDTEKSFSYHWIDFNGNERYYGSVGPGESVSQHTFPGHVWAVKDAGGRTFAIFVAERETGRAIVSDDVRLVSDDRDGGDDVEDARVADGSDSAWMKLEVAGLGWVHGEDTDGGTPNLNEETTPGTWGASAYLTIGKPFVYGGAWAVYRTDDGTVVQAVVFGNSVYDPPWAGAAWRVHPASGWGDWNYGTGPARMGIELPSATAGSVTIAQAGQLSLPFPSGREEWKGKSEREWNSTSVLLIHDDGTGSQTAIACYLPCGVWQRASAPAVTAVETDTSDDEAVVDEETAAVVTTADSAWVKLNYHNEFDYHSYIDLDKEITPGTWGGCDETTLNKPSHWCGSWAVYRTDEGTVVQVAVWGSERYPTYTGAVWRVYEGSRWESWHYGTGPFGIDVGGKAPRQMDIEAAPTGPVTIVQASQINLPMPRGDSPWIDSISESEWLSTWLLMVHDEVAGTQTVVQCDNGCRAWQRTPPSTVAVERDISIDETIETELGAFRDFSRDRIARVLDQALAATTWNVHGDEVPDWTTRLRALELVIEIFGDGSKVDAGDASLRYPAQSESESSYAMTRAVFDERPTTGTPISSSGR